MQQVDDVLLRLELHQCGAVVLAEFGQCRAHVPQHRPVVLARVEPGRAAAEELALGQQLLMDFQPAHESDCFVVNFLMH